MQPAIIVHGGAWDIPVELHEAHRQGTRRAVQAGWAVLEAGGAAMDAVEAAIVIMEDNGIPVLRADRSGRAPRV